MQTRTNSLSAERIDPNLERLAHSRHAFFNLPRVSCPAARNNEAAQYDRSLCGWVEERRDFVLPC